MQLGEDPISDTKPGRLSAVGVASRYGLNGTGFETRFG